MEYEQAYDQSFSDYCEREGISTDTCKDFLKSGNLFFLNADDWDWKNVQVDEMPKIKNPFTEQETTNFFRDDFNWDIIYAD